MLARIYRPTKTAMQSGQALTKNWILEFEPSQARTIDPLMGWTSSGDMLNSQVRLRFATKEEAVAYAEKHGIAFQVFEPHVREATPKAYSDNFRYDRKGLWTH
ncbi:MAG: ETC complex I subunit [Alphaproteobacteria bacterium]|nr:ETC complex I subunit [Alphaproteobacteria bacterium]